MTRELIDGAIDSIAGFIVAYTSENLHKPLDETMELFLSSRIYALLRDHETGFYWDSVPEMCEMFLREISPAIDKNGGAAHPQ
jgi:hypothetical protein